VDDLKFREKIRLLSDPYFDREFFTNLIYCVDRHKTVRDIFDVACGELASVPYDSKEDVDRALLHLFYSYQASNSVKENYQWLPISQGLYSLALYRTDGQKPIHPPGKPYPWPSSQSQGATLQDFTDLIRRDVREVESFKQAWASLLFLLDNRSTRSQAAGVLVKQALTSSDPLTFELITKALDMALSSGWKSNAYLLKRPFERFWKQRQKTPEIVDRGFRLANTISSNPPSSSMSPWDPTWTEELWLRVANQSSESVWEFVEKISQEGAYPDQLFSIFNLFRGRVLFSMKTEQWPRTTSSLLYADALQSVSRFLPQDKWAALAIDILDLISLVQLVGPHSHMPRPTGESILEGVSRNISKDRLILRLDDALEKGERSEALELMAVILKDQGLSHSVADRLLLVASKQDGWTYDFKTISTALTLTKAFEASMRIAASGESLSDGLFGLLRFLSDQRDVALKVVPKTGTYGDGLSLSQFDVSQGARIVDRFVFNQLRNAQRVKVWPSDN